jgi:hypothetical protein
LNVATVAYLFKPPVATTNDHRFMETSPSPSRSTPHSTSGATKDRGNWFVRVLIVAFCIFLATLVVYRYFYVEPKADISGGLLVVLAFVLVLVLSELFDNFSVGKVVTMSRALKEREQEKTELKRENMVLRGQVVAVTTNISQRQSSTNILGWPEALADALTVKKAAPEEIEKKKIEDNGARAQAVHERRFDRSKIEDFGISKFLSLQGSHAFNLIQEAKLSTQFSGIDPITDVTPIFDGYFNTSDSEVFIEVRATDIPTIMYRDKLYVMLAKIHHYKVIKKVNVYLVLVLVKIPEPESRPTGPYVDRLQREFGPAMTSGLLRIRVIDPTPEDLTQLHGA